MKPGFKFFSVAALLSCSLCGVSAINSYKSDAVSRTIGVFGVLSVMGAGTNFVNAFPPILQKRLGSPTPQIGGGKFSVSFEDEDSDEDEDDLLESSPRIEPRITPNNRDQCLAKLLCGMSVPVTGGGSKKNYYSEYAQIVSKFFEAFPLDDDYQSKESMETYDDYSNEDDKPTRVNSKRKPLNSSRVEATAPTLQLFDLASVDVGPKKEDLLGKNRTRKDDIDKVPTGNRIARARRIVENIGQKLQTVRQCQSISGCPFTFKQLREKLKKSEAKRVASNVPLPGPIWPINPNRNKDPTPTPFQIKSKPKPSNRPIPPTSKPEPLSVEGLFSNEEPIFPFKDTNKGDDELEEIFGPPKVHKRPGSGFHQGVDDNYHYEYNPDKPWRPGGSNNGGNSYGYRPWKTRPNNNQNQRPHSGQNNNQNQRPHSGQNNNQNQRPNSGQNNQNQNQRPQQHRPSAPARPGLRPAQKKTPGNNKPLRNRPYSGQPPLQQRPAAKVSQAPPPPPPPPKTTAAPATTRSPFPKKKISYQNTQYQSPSGTGEDDEDAEDINKVAPVELVGNSDAGEPEVKSTTAAPKTTEASKNNDDSDEYDDDDGDYYEGGDYDDDDDEDDDAQDDEKEDDDDYSDEDEKNKADEKKVEDKKKKRIKKKAEKLQSDQKVKDTVKKVEKSKKKASGDPYFDDETDDVKEIWSKLNLGATGANYKFKAPDKKKEKVEEETKAVEKTETVANDAEEESDEDEEDDEEEGRKGSLITLSQKNRASSTSTSASDEDDDDEVDDEKESKGKKPARKTREKPKKGEKGDKSELNDDQTTKSKKDSKKSKKKGSTKKEEDSEEKSERAKWKHVMSQIGGRPLVPKPEPENNNNAKLTSGLVSNHFKLQFINPYGGGAPPEPLDNLDGNNHRPYQPMSATPPPGASGFASALPFKLNMNMNAGPLGAFSGGISAPETHGHHGMAPGGPPEGHGHHGMGSRPGGPPEGHGHHGMGPPGTRGSMEFSGPPQNNHHQQHNHQQGGPPPPYSHSYLQSGPSGGNTGGGGLSGSSLFKLNPLPALSKLFKRPSSSQNSFDPMQQSGGGSGPQGGHNHNAPAMNAFVVQRPIGPESSSYRRGAITPASGSSSKKGSKKSSKAKGKKKTKF